MSASGWQPREPRLHVVTGATGLLGGAVVLRILREDPGASVVCLVRPGEVGARVRVQRHLTDCANDYGLRYLGPAIAWKVHAVEWDMDFPSAVGLAECTTFWHFAVGTPERDTSVFERHTEVLADLVSACAREGVREFVFASSAHVGEVPRDGYEWAKKTGEDLVLGERRLYGRVLRPVAVVGDSVTYATRAATYGGLYTLARLGRCQEEPAVPQQWALDVVPVDVAAQQALAGSGPVTWLNSPNSLCAAAVANAAASPVALPRRCEQVRDDLLRAFPYLPDQVAVPRGEGPEVTLADVRGWTNWYERSMVRPLRRIVTVPTGSYL